MARGILAVLVGLGLIVATMASLANAFDLSAVEPGSMSTPAGEADTEARESFAILLLLQVSCMVIAGGLTAFIAPAGRKMFCAAVVAFIASIGLAYVAVFSAMGPLWYHVLTYAAALLAPALGGQITSRKTPDVV